ncbi:hypothetical protein MD484_g8236, partial [Candolleomyces efflorescens]
MSEPEEDGEGSSESSDEEVSIEQCRALEAEAVRRSARLNLQPPLDQPHGAAVPNNPPALGEEELLANEPTSRMDHLQRTQEFIRSFRSATLFNGKLNSKVIEQLISEPQEQIEADIAHPDIAFSLDLDMSLESAGGCVKPGL